MTKHNNVNQEQVDCFPPPPLGKEGWPWGANPEKVPSLTQCGKPWPKISIVTPSYNQGPFLEETIRSVLLQGYPNLEYIIMDGGSTDNSVEIIKKYEPWLTSWVSEKDNGQADAIHRGFMMATGELIAWQNSDDYYLPGALHAVARAYLNTPDFDVYHGRTFHCDLNGNTLKTVFSESYETDRINSSFPTFNFSNQALFFNRNILGRGIKINQKYRNAFDIDFYVQLAISECKYISVPDLEGVWRIYEEIRTITQYEITCKEYLEIYDGILTNKTLSPEIRMAAEKGLKQFIIYLFRNGYETLFRTGFKKYLGYGYLNLADLKMWARFVSSHLKFQKSL